VRSRPLGGDLLAGSGNTHIATLIERRSRFLLLVKVEGKETETVVAALSRQVGTLPHPGWHANSER
jgi:IS30 family transposase